jgi:hypothetical protein
VTAVYSESLRKIRQDFSEIMKTGDHPAKRKEMLPMKKSFLLKLTILLLTLSTLSGCLWVERDGYRHGDSHGGDRGNHRGNRH